MKSILIAFLATFMFLSCGITKNKTNTKESTKTTEKTNESKVDSSSTLTKTLPTESELVYDLDDLSKNVGDFIQKMNSGNGNETEIKKQGSKIYIKNKTGGSKDSKTKVNKETKEVIYNSEYVIQETKILIKRIPFRYWLIIILLIIITFRKFIFQILCSMFPVLKSYRLFSLFLGNK